MIFLYRQVTEFEMLEKQKLSGCGGLMDDKSKRSEVIRNIIDL